MNITIYNQSSGKIERLISCPDDEISAQVFEGEGYTQGHYSGQSHYWDGEGMVTFPTPRPSESHVWIRETAAWVDPRPLDEVKAERWEHIKQVRTAKVEGGFMSQGHPFQSDSESKTNIIGGAQLAQVVGPSFSNTWTCSDNTIVVLNQEQMIQVGVDMGIHINAMHAIARDLRADIDAAITAEEVAAVVWPE